MSLINFNEIDFNKSINKDTKKINFNGSTIEIVPYLSVEDKYDFIMITLQKALDKNIYNPFLIDVFFDLHLVYLYTNIVFSNEDRKDEMHLYNTLKNSGLIGCVRNSLNQLEIDELYKYIYHLIDMIMKYKNTFGAVFSTFVEQLPTNMEKAKEFIEGMDLSKIEGLATMLKETPMQEEVLSAINKIQSVQE